MVSPLQEDLFRQDLRLPSLAVFLEWTPPGPREKPQASFDQTHHGRPGHSQWNNFLLSNLGLGIQSLILIFRFLRLTSDTSPLCPLSLNGPADGPLPWLSSRSKHTEFQPLWTRSQHSFSKKTSLSVQI